MRRRLVAVAAVAAALCGAPPLAAQGSGWTASPDDALLLETRLGPYRLGEGVRGYATPETPGGSCLILADVSATLDLALTADSRAGTLRGWAFAESNRIEVDRRAGTLRLRGRAAPLGFRTIRDAPEGWCVDAAALSAWLGVSLVADQPNALLIVRSDTKLPVERALERRARAAAAPAPPPPKLARIKLPYLSWRAPALDAVVTVNGVRDARYGSRLARRYELFASGEALRLSVDARLASDDRGRPASLRARAYRTDPDGGLLGRLRATHAAIGDVAGFSSPLVSQSLGGRGAAVTNRPVDRADSFDATSFRGELPAGWDAELYRNGQLLRFGQDRADGRYEFLDVPLLYGANRFEIVLYGPQGQLRRRTETVSVGAESIPRGKNYYHAGFSQDDRDLVRLVRRDFGQRRGWRGSLGLEHGLDAKTSLSAQLHTLVLRDERLTFVEGAVRRAVGPALVELSAAYETGGGLAMRAQMIGQIGRTYVSAEAVRATRGFRSDRVEPGVTSRHSLAVDHAFLIGRTMFPGHAEVRYVGRRDGPSTLEAAARLSASFRDISLTAGLDFQSQRARGRDPPLDRLVATALANGRVGRVRVRGEARYRLSGEDLGVDGATLVGEWGASDVAQWRAEIGYDAPASRGRAALGWSRRFRNFALGATAEAASDGSVAAGLNLAFSVGPAGRGGVRVTSGKLGSSGTAIARVFRDLNGDGVRQPGEPPEAGVRLTAGTANADALTDAQGRAIIDDLPAHRALALGVDESSLADPLIRPRDAGRTVVPRPGVAFALDVPLVGAGEIEGTLVGANGGVEGVDLELVDARGGVAATTRTDFDGYFLFEGARYGEYGLRIAKLSADAAGLAPALSARAVVSAATPTVRLGRIAATSTKPREIAVNAAE